MLILMFSNEYMKVQLAKLKADQEKSGKKAEHKVSFSPSLLDYRHHCQAALTCLGELQDSRPDVGQGVSRRIIHIEHS